MGCSDSRDTSEIHALKIQCENLCEENLSILQLLEYLLIEKNNISEAILLISLKKRTESYYLIISKYRNFWITEAKNSFEVSRNRKDLSPCLKEQEREKSRLSFTRQALQEQIEKQRPGWQDHYKTLKNFMEALESDSSIMQRSSSLYGNFYMKSRKELKLAAKEHSKNIEALPGSVYEAVKNVTVSFYKIAENRVYFTNKIMNEKTSTGEKFQEKGKKTKKSKRNKNSSVITLNNSAEFGKNLFEKSKLSIDLNKLITDQVKNPLNRARTSHDQYLSTDLRLSSDQGRPSVYHHQGSFDHQVSNAETLHHLPRYEKSESFSSLEDEETLARLSYTQK
jgi:hypothetical protein